MRDVIGERFQPRRPQAAASAIDQQCGADLNNDAAEVLGSAGHRLPPAVHDRQASVSAAGMTLPGAALAVATSAAMARRTTSTPSPETDDSSNGRMPVALRNFRRRASAVFLSTASTFDDAMISGLSTRPWAYAASSSRM